MLQNGIYQHIFYIIGIINTLICISNSSTVYCTLICFSSYSSYSSIVIYMAVKVHTKPEKKTSSAKSQQCILEFSCNKEIIRAFSVCAFLISLFCLFCFSFHFAKLNSQSVWSLTDGSNAELAEKPLMVVRLVPKVPNTTQKLGNGQWTFFCL